MTPLDVPHGQRSMLDLGRNILDGDREAAGEIVTRCLREPVPALSLSEVIARVPKLLGRVTPFGFDTLADAWAASLTAQEIRDLPTREPV